MKILCFGDSNTYGYDPRSYLGSQYPAQHRWVDILAQKRKCKVINAGENGREIPRREGELLGLKQMIEGFQPLDLLIIMLGTNDLLQGNSAITVLQRMERFLEQIPLCHGRLLLIGPVPMQLGDWVPTQSLVEASKELNKEYKTLAHRLGIPFVDAGEWGVSLTFDGVHFTEEGHNAFADGVLDYLNSCRSF